MDASNITALKSMIPWSSNETWDKYIYNFKNDEYKCWENTTTKTVNYSSGGVELGNILIGANRSR